MDGNVGYSSNFLLRLQVQNGSGVSRDRIEYSDIYWRGPLVSSLGFLFFLFAVYLPI